MRRYRTRFSQWVSESQTLLNDLTDVTLVSEDSYWGLYFNVTLTIGDTMEMMFEVAMGVMDMEDDKVADMALKIPNEDFTDGTVVIDGTISKWRWC